VPFLIGGGAHALEDIPRLVGLPEGSDPRRGSVAGRLFLIDEAVGTYAGMEEIVVDLARRHTPPPAPRFRPRMVTHVRKEPGPVHLVGGGPGDPGLITSRGLELLRTADVVVHDRLIGAELLQEARADAELIDAGKGPGHAPYTQAEINALLVDRARLGRTVVRLKGGDPFVFGRGAEEVLACLRAGVPVTVVPGVTSAVGVPASAWVPVTHRGVAQEFHVVSVHVAPGDERSTVNWELLGGSSGTLVLLMAVERIGAVADELLRYGRSPDTPVSVIADGTLPTQRTINSTLEQVESRVAEEGVRPPAIVVVGDVVSVAAEITELMRHVTA